MVTTVARIDPQRTKGEIVHQGAFGMGDGVAENGKQLFWHGVGLSVFV
jgi:hypothetical protein